RGRIARAVEAALETLVRQELDSGYGDLESDWGQADDHRATPRAEDVPGLPDRGGDTHHLDRVVDPAAGELQHRADSVIRRSVASLGSAGGQRSLQLFLAAVDRDDLPRSGSRAAATTWRPTPPQPMTHTVSPRRTRATLRTAPTPVTTAHPISAACQS